MGCGASSDQSRAPPRSIQDYEVIKTLGVGGSCKVLSVIDKQSEKKTRLENDEQKCLG